SGMICEWYQSSMSKEKAARWRMPSAPHAVDPEPIPLVGAAEEIGPRVEPLPGSGSGEVAGSVEHVGRAARRQQPARVALEIGLRPVEIRHHRAPLQDLRQRE